MKGYWKEFLSYALWILLGLVLGVANVTWHDWPFFAVLLVVLIISTNSFSRGLDSGIRIGKLIRK